MTKREIVSSVPFDIPEQDRMQAAGALVAAAPLLLEHAEAAIEGMREAIRIIDLMGRGQSARDLAIYMNNLRHAVATARGER